MDEFKFEVLYNRPGWWRRANDPRRPLHQVHCPACGNMTNASTEAPQPLVCAACGERYWIAWPTTVTLGL